MKTDKLLIEEYLDGNNNSFDILVNRYREPVFYHILRTIKNTTLADDFFQDTWIKVLNSIKAGKYKEQGKFLPWVKLLAKNLIGDYFRKVNRNRQLTFEDYQLESLVEIEVETDFFNNEDFKIIHQLINKLPESQKEVINEIFFNKKKFKEYSIENQISINTALGRKRYAINNLTKMYNNYQRGLVCFGNGDAHLVSKVKKL
jgi:RNA polymerase sigma factor (sigma-70 family)